MVTVDKIQKLRQKTGAGIMDCKKALKETKGDFDEAIIFLRQKGLAEAKKRVGKATKEGLIQSYIHLGSKIGVLLEVNCETDFVARTPEFKTFVKDLCLHIAAANPLFLTEKDIPENVIEKEKEIYKHQAQETKKPVKVMEKIAEGRLKKYYMETCLLHQPFVKDDKKTVETLLKEIIARLGENIVIKRFTRYHLGE